VRARVVVALILGALAGGAACTASAPPATPPPSKTGWHKAPPKIGSSITHTKICECRTCDPSSCCQGERESSRKAECKDSYDFSTEGCGLAVESCTSRCGKHVWRVPLDETCEERPGDCC
jgi:hypothetical protein